MGGKTATGKTSEEWLRLLMEAQKEYQQYVDTIEFCELLRKINKKQEEPLLEWYLAPSPEYPLTTDEPRMIYEEEPWDEATEPTKATEEGGAKPNKTGAEQISEEYRRTAEKVKKQYERYLEISGIYDLPTGKQEPLQEQYFPPSPEYPLTTDEPRMIYEKYPWDEATEPTEEESVKPGKTGAKQASEEYQRTMEKVKKRHMQYEKISGIHELPTGKRKSPQEQHLAPSPENPLTSNEPRRT